MQIVSSTGQTTLTAAIASTGATAISVASSINIAAGVVIQIDNELLQVTNVSGLNLTVTRGYGYTTAATHSNAATVTIMASIVVGPLLNATTAAPATAQTVTFAQIRVDGTVLAGGAAAAIVSWNGSAWVQGTDSWGEGMIFLSLAAGSHRVTIESTGCLPWCEPAFYVGPLGALAIKSAGLALAVPGNVTSYDSTHVVTNLAWASFNTPTMIGQILTFTSGALNGQSFNVSSYSASGGTWLKLGFTPAWAGANPAAGDAFVISNVATAASLAAGMNTLPNATAQLIIDQTGANGSDASPIQTLAGRVNQVAPISPEGFTELWAIKAGGNAGILLPYQQVLNGAGLYYDAANRYPLGWNEGGIGRWAIAYGYGTGQWIGPATQNSPLGVYTSSNGQASITVVAPEPTALPSEIGSPQQAGQAVTLPTTPPSGYGGLTGTQATQLATAAANNPAAVIAALIAGGVLQYVSGSSGPLQLTQTAMAQVPIPPAVNIQTLEVIDESC